jgi:pyruvate,orthophosphate dikinase
MKYVYSPEEVDVENKALFGEKACRLCDMIRIGINIPPCFIITTEACREYFSTKDQTFLENLMYEIKQHICRLELITGKKFGGIENPLLVSVRSGAAISMPGMLDTILNLGLNYDNLNGLIKSSQNEYFAYDTYCRFLKSFGKVVFKIPDAKFYKQIHLVNKALDNTSKANLNVQALKELSEYFINIIRICSGKDLPQDTYRQLEMAIQAIFNSWTNKRAEDYRQHSGNDQPFTAGTAVSVVSMIFGNMGDASASGVAMTRDPNTGNKQLFGEYLNHSQGEDLVGGDYTPKSIEEMQYELPESYNKLRELCQILEEHYREVQEFEFTIEQGTLYCLQTRDCHMSLIARLRTSVELVQEGLIDKYQAIRRVNIQTLKHSKFSKVTGASELRALTQGIPASPGIASGAIVFDLDRIKSQQSKLTDIILVREKTKTEDFHGIMQSRGVLTSSGGKTSHAAVVARAYGKPCVVGADEIVIDAQRHQAFIRDVVLSEGDIISVDGSTGSIYLGIITTAELAWPKEIDILINWAEEIG